MAKLENLIDTTLLGAYHDELMQATGFYYDKTYKTMYVGGVSSSTGQTLYKKVLDGFNSPVVVDGNSKIAYFVIGEETYCLLNSTGNTFVPSVVNTKNYTVVSSPIAVLSKNKTFEYGGQSWIWNGSAYAPENTIATLKINAELAFSSASIDVYLNSDVEEPTLSNKHGLTVTWSSSDTGVATVNSSGEVTTVGEGTTTITASFAGDYFYNADSASYSLSVIIQRNNIVIYKASAKLAETTSDKTQGLHTNAFNANIVSHEFADGTGIITFDEDVTTIYNYAFYGITSLTSLTLPSTVAVISGSYAFLGGFSSSSLIINNPTPPSLLESANLSGFATIYVPSDSVNTYKSTWSDVASKIQAI